MNRIRRTKWLYDLSFPPTNVFPLLKRMFIFEENFREGDREEKTASIAKLLVTRDIKSWCKYTALRFLGRDRVRTWA